MIDIIDFTNFPLSSRNLQYAGRAGEKRGIIYKKSLWFLKFPKNTIGMNNIHDMSYVTSPLSEYIGSHIFSILGYDAHETELGIYYDGKRYKVVCACKDFINDDKNEILIPYTALRNDTSNAILKRNSESFLSASNLNEIIFQLNNNAILKNINDINRRFWDTAVIDIFINNNDRNEDNWGVIKFKKENTYKLAPIFDNGNSFYSKTDENRIIEILNDNEKLLSSAINGITAYDDDNECRISIKNLLIINNIDLKYSINNVYKKIVMHFTEIEKMINEIPETINGIEIMTENRKKYYIETLKIRLNLLSDFI